jgi:hypothetical protein
MSIGSLDLQHIEDTGILSARQHQLVSYQKPTNYLISNGIKDKQKMLTNPMHRLVHYSLQTLSSTFPRTKIETQGHPRKSKDC